MKKKFKVFVTYTTCADEKGDYHTRTQKVEVEAENQTDAEMKAYQNAINFPDHGNTISAKIAH